ncbi:venom carboxylesterase-6-like isoform X2 [Sitophilus oryzae]|uniref:Carboxylic ester hydrolase n=1 Tax=Sitophilus oryzae TaxID=7048 RepID=A0A6J2XL57_SITOR|nr:venom carboxylesterase-6-like isoform X2 [Sitophilus oryzae]
MNILFILVLIYIPFVISEDVFVTISQGTLRGHILTSPGNKTFRVFQGIPYAQPPVGNLRFQAPQPPLKWDGIRDATKDGNICFAVTKDSPNESEDCLFVNVFVPVLDSDNKTKFPVLLSIHGGGFTHGSSVYKEFGPDYLIEQEIIVVTLNYRLGPFGFLSTDDDVVSGNAGLKDQAAAIKWTYENIEVFGGDINKITISGQSAGSASVGFQLLYKGNEGYFRGAIMESGSPLNMWSFSVGFDPKAYAVDLAQQVNATIDANISSTDLLDFLVGLDGKDIDTASTKTTVSTSALPVIERESETAFLTSSQYELLENGDFIRVPILIGTNSEEDIHYGQDLEQLEKYLEVYEKNIERFIPTNLILSDTVNKSTVGKTIRDLYLENIPDDEKLGHLIKFMSHNTFTRAIIKHASLAANYTQIFFYVFSYDGPLGNVNITVKGADKVAHGEETKYLWKQVGYNDDLSKFPASDVLTYNRLISLWTNFVKYLRGRITSKHNLATI